MVRDLRFRAWDKASRKWLLCADIVADGIFHSTGRNTATISIARRDDIDLVRPTGLNDKNGEEIYEGHIVQRVSRITGEVDHVAEVYWDKEMSGFYVRGKNLGALNTILGIFLKGYADEPQYEIIGNRYENPELLESK